AAGVSAFELNSDFEREQIYSNDDVIVCSTEHPLAGKKNLKLADLCEYAWLVPYSRPADLNTIVDAFAAENLPPPAQLIGSDAYRIGMQLLADSDLLVMVSPALIEPELNQPVPFLTQLDITKPTIRRHASLIYPRTRPLTAPAQLLLDEVRKFAQAKTSSES
ncbi:MAG: LysR substrate-binding domain-containing protein, partial [Gammaproteobacteria bacterium]